jgi:hypothetical protein
MSDVAAMIGLLTYLSVSKILCVCSSAEGATKVREVVSGNGRKLQEAASSWYSNFHF